MHRIKLASALVAASVLLGGCKTIPFGDLISIANAQISNPVSATNIYQAKNGYAAALELAAGWRQYCFSMPYKVIMADPVAKPVCSKRRAVVRALRTYGPKAGDAIADAEIFVMQNPTLDASAMISLAVDAVARFRSVIPAKQ